MCDILLIGTGGVGSYYGAKLALAGARVATVCRSDYEVVRKNGIMIQSIGGAMHFIPEMVLRNVADYDREPDFIIIATKVLPDIDPGMMIRERVYPKTAIVLLQNGIDIEEPVVRAFPNNEIISALAFICVERLAPGLVDHQDFGRLVVGVYPEGTSPRSDLLCDLWKASGVPCETDRDIIGARWRKLVWNAPLNPISVLAGGVDTSVMMASAPTVHLAKKAMEEVLLLAAAAGHPLDPGIIKKNIDDTTTMKPFRTSMLQDFESKRPMEVEAILGNALRIAREYQVPVPHLESLYGLLFLANERNLARTV